MELSADDRKLQSGLQRARVAVQSFGLSLGKLGLSIAGLGAGILTPITGFFVDAVSYAANMKLLASETGDTVENVSALAYAFNTVGVEQDEFLRNTKSLGKELSAAADGAQQADEHFSRLGLSARDLINLSLKEQFIAIAAAIERIPRGADRAAVASEFFGRNGTRVLRLFANGSAELEKRLRTAGEVGAVVSEQQAEAAFRIRAAWGQVWASVRFTFMEIGKALFGNVDQIENLAQQFVGYAATARRVIAANRPLILTILSVGAALLTAGTAIAVLGGGLAAASVAVGGFLSAYTLVYTVLAATLPVILPFVAGFAAPFVLLGAAILEGWYLLKKAEQVGQTLADLDPFKVIAVTGAGRRNAESDLAKSLGKFNVGKIVANSIGEGILYGVERIRFLVSDFVEFWKVRFLQAGQFIIAELGYAWTRVRDTAVAAWGGIASAITRGDLASAAEIGMAAVEVVIQASNLRIKGYWADLILWLKLQWITLQIQFRTNIFSGGPKAAFGIVPGGGKFVDWVNDKLGVTDWIARSTKEKTKAAAQARVETAGLPDMPTPAAGPTIDVGAIKNAWEEILSGAQNPEVIKKGIDAVSKGFSDVLAGASEEIQRKQPGGALQLAEERLNRLLAAERERAAAAGGGGPAAEAGRAGAAAIELGQSSRGAFSAGDYLGVFNVGNQIAQRQIALTEEQLAEVKKTNRLLGDGGGVFSD